MGENIKNRVQYPYAYNEDGNLVFILDVDDEYRRKHTFTCPSCGHAMRPRLGSRNAHCFAHSEGEKCSPDRYIHDAAKLILKRRFDGEGSFTVKFRKWFACKDMHTCEDFIDTVCRFSDGFWEVDMKNSYSECLMERRMGEFIPDLTLVDPSGKHDPVFIEIWHKHKSTEEKMSSGHHIIEIRLKSFDDLKALEDQPLEESENITFTGFKVKEFIPDRKLNNPDLKEHCKKCWTESQWREHSNIRRYTILDDGQAFSESILEKEIGIHRRRAVFDMVYDKKLDLNIFVDLDYIAVLFGGKIAKRCVLCEHCGYSSWDDKHHWCTLRLNGTTKKRTFNNLKAVECGAFELSHWYPSIGEWQFRDDVLAVWHREDAVETK